MADPVVQNVTTNTSNLPDYAQPYFENLLQRGQALSYQDYSPYPGQRIAGFTPGQQYAQQGAFNLTDPTQYGTATNMATQAGLGSLAASSYAPTTFDGGTFGKAQADQYMSPYIQSVIDAQKREAITDSQKTQLMQNLGAARQGTYGGSRQLIAGLERERSLGQNLGDIQAKGLQAAYENAQNQFNTDRSARLQAGQMGEQSKQFGSSLGLQGLAQALQSSQTLGTLGQNQQNSALQRIQAQASAGSEQQNLQQQYYDTNYSDFLRQRDYPTELLNNYSSLLRGVPVQPSSTSTAYAPPPSMASQIGGLGLGALSLSKLLG